MRFRESSLAILSPGQGIQQPGMGEAVYNASDEAKRVFYTASEVTGVDMAEVCFGSQTDRLEETLIAQPAITTVSISEGLYLQELGLRFDLGMGHSLGEMALLSIARILPVEDTLRITHKRAEATYRASQEHPGGMVAMSGLSREQAAKHTAHIIAKGRVKFANLNGRFQQVFSGDHDRLAELEELARNLRITDRLRIGFTRLRTGGAFHSPDHMETAVDEFHDAMSGLRFSTPEFELLLNNARYLSEVGIDGLASYLSQQLVSEVDFEKSAARAVADGVTNFIEVGPISPKAKYKTISGLIKRDFNERIHIIEVQEFMNSSKSDSLKSNPDT